MKTVEEIAKDLDTFYCRLDGPTDFSDTLMEAARRISLRDEALAVAREALEKAVRWTDAPEFMAALSEIDRLLSGEKGIQ